MGVPRLLSSSGKSGVSSVSANSEIEVLGEGGDGSKHVGVGVGSSSQRTRLLTSHLFHNRHSNSETSLHSISPLASPNGSFIQTSALTELELEDCEVNSTTMATTHQLPAEEDDLNQEWGEFDDQRHERETDGTLSPTSEFGDEWQESLSPRTADAQGLDEEGLGGGSECANSVSTTSENSDDGCLDAFLFSDEDSGSDSDAAGSDVSSISSQGLSYSSSTSQDAHKKVMINTAFNRGFALKRDPQDPLYSKSPIFPHQQLFSSFPLDQAPSRLILSLTDPSELKDQADDGDSPRHLPLIISPPLTPLISHRLLYHPLVDSPHHLPPMISPQLIL